LPQYVVASYIDLLIDYFGELFWGVDCVMAISAHSKSDMLAYCARAGLPAPMADHFPLGADLSGKSAAGGTLPAVLEGKRYALYVSTIEPRKNHRLLYEAWDYCLRHGLIDRERDRLVFVGRAGWNVGDLMHEMTVNPNTAGTIVILSDVSDAELARLYRDAAFGLFPSLYEGYGLPLAEMLSLGKACLSSRSGSLEEVGGDLVTYIDPIDRIEWAKNIARFFKDEAVVAQAERRIREEYKIVTWDASAQEFFGKVEKMVAAGSVSRPIA
jgi:glycosyltransferase involved in cell wall biosynthesis